MLVRGAHGAYFSDLTTKSTVKASSNFYHDQEKPGMYVSEFKGPCSGFVHISTCTRRHNLRKPARTRLELVINQFGPIRPIRYRIDLVGLLLPVTYYLLTTTYYPLQYPPLPTTHYCTYYCTCYEYLLPVTSTYHTFDYLLGYYLLRYLPAEIPVPEVRKYCTVQYSYSTVGCMELLLPILGTIGTC